MGNLENPVSLIHIPLDSWRKLEYLEENQETLLMQTLHSEPPFGQQVNHCPTMPPQEL